MTSSSRSRASRAVLAAAAAALTFSACTSQPSPHRVAEDLINTLAESDEERECMLDVLDTDEYSNSNLEEWGSEVDSGQPGTAAYDEAQAALDGLQADLEACRR